VNETTTDLDRFVCGNASGDAEDDPATVQHGRLRLAVVGPKLVVGSNQYDLVGGDFLERDR
jgi:hypothetical protein